MDESIFSSVQTLTVGLFGTNCYILETQAKEVLVVDPGAPSRAILEAVKELEGALRYILCTHGHLDHIEGAALLKEELGGDIVLHEGDLPLWEKAALQASFFGLPPPDPLPPPDHLLSDDATLRLDGGKIEVLHTPGHSPGSVCYVDSGSGRVFNGDTVFAMGVGRVDLWGGDAAALRRSIEERIFALPEHFRLYPGHGPTITVGEARRTGPLSWL